MIDSIQTNLNELATLIETNPSRAAEQLESMARHLLHIAGLLKNQTDRLRSPAGVIDRLQMEVIGPDGKVKQTVDTGAPS